MKTTHILCDCISPEHSLRFDKFDGDEEIYVHIQLNPLPFSQRLKVALKYLITGKARGFSYEETIIGKEKQLDIIKLFQ